MANELKVLLVTRTSHPEGVGAATGGKRIRSCIAALESMGIKYRRRMIVNAQTWSAAESTAVSAEYDAIVIPSNNGGFSLLVNDSNITIPIFILSGDAALGVSNYGTTPGVTGSAAALSSYWVSASFTSQRWFALYGRSYELSGGTAILSVAAASPLDETPQANADHVMAWSTTKTGGSKLYASAVGAEIDQVLHILMQTAIDDGEMASPPRRSPMVIDLDHINGDNVVTGGVLDDASNLDVIASFIPKGGVMWCGIHNLDVTLGNITAEIIGKLKKYSHPNGPFKYCWHDHKFSPIIGANLDADGYSTDVTKAQQDTLYQADEAIWNGIGLEFHTPIYYNSGSNSWDEASLQLYTRESQSKVGSPANDTAQAGYGAKAFRQIGRTGSSSRPCDNKENLWVNQHKAKRRVRGIQIFTTFDVAFSGDMPYDAIGDWINNTQYVLQSMWAGQTLYLHEGDFVTAEQDPGVIGKFHGQTIVQLFRDIGTYCKDVAHVFADPTDYVY